MIAYIVVSVVSFILGFSAYAVVSNALYHSMMNALGCQPPKRPWWKIW